MQQFYITTPLYYVNDQPHLGTAYCTIVADTLNRFHKLFGEKTLFLTGTDEHGQKCQQAAESRGLTPQKHCDKMVQNFKEAWEELDISYDIFFRTTDLLHKNAVQLVLQELHEKGDIYENDYEGWYSISEEIFYTEKELVDGKSPTGKDVQKVSEKNYFFRMSKYQEQLVNYINDNPQFIQPEVRKNEVLGFLKQPLNDLCISRPKSRMSWGIDLPFDDQYVTYVWFDALLNYAVGVGLKQKDRSEYFQNWWHRTGATHLIGKDIITTHSVYWTTILMAINIPLPKTIFAHGWILNKESEKMSKSQGDVVNPLDMKNIVGVDALRYFLIRDIHLGNDAPYSTELFLNCINNDLANNLGNMLSRTSNLIHKYFEGKAPGLSDDLRSSSANLKAEALSVAQKVKVDIERMAPSYALEHIIKMLNQANRFLEEKAPWKSVKTDPKSAGNHLHLALECLRIAGILLSPVMPSKSKELLQRLGQQECNFEKAGLWGQIAQGTPIVKGDPLFPRVQKSKT